MITVYLTSADRVHSLLNDILREKLGSFNILKNTFGKPYIEGNALFFNISHSKTRAAIAISSSPVGVDLEVLHGRNYDRIITSFSKREQEKILSESDFLKSFTAREAYAKKLGVSLASVFKKLEFFNGEIYINSKKAREKLKHFDLEYGILCLCGDIEQIEIINL